MGIDPRGAGRIQQCEIGSGLRSDLWRFDTDTLKWEEAAPDGAPDIPAPREVQRPLCFTQHKLCLTVN